jgi:uncharacterized coiled-coil DUF342 family protein
MIERVTLSKENEQLSLKLQELYKQVNEIQNERMDFGRLHQDLSRQIQENTRKLDQLLVLCGGRYRASQPSMPLNAKTAV